MREKREALKQLVEGLNSIIIGKEEAIDLVVVSLLAGGHILLEDIPGVGKTTLAKGVATLTGTSFGRISFTPDTLPSDISGYSIFNPQKGEFSFTPGVIMNQVVLADEINRTSPKTQSALLEAMEEKQVTVDGKTYPLPDPFFVIATQNPTDFLGTYRLPEAQLDRFFIRLSLGYPKREQETAMLLQYVSGHKWNKLANVLTPEELCEMQQEVLNVTVHKDLIQYMLDIVEQTRKHEYITLGVSPRGSLALVRGAMAMAYLRGRDFVIPEDIASIVVPVLAHRIMLSSVAKMNQMTEEKVIMAIKNQVKVPVL